MQFWMHIGGNDILRLFREDKSPLTMGVSGIWQYNFAIENPKF
jgi:hypothetical protein